MRAPGHLQAELRAERIHSIEVRDMTAIRLMIQDPTLQADLVTMVAGIGITLRLAGRSHGVALSRDALAHPNATREILEQGLAANIPGWDVLVARSSVLPADLAARMLATGSTPICQWVVSNPVVPAEVILAHVSAANVSSDVLLSALYALRGAPRQQVADIVWVRLSESNEPLIGRWRLLAGLTSDPGQISALCLHPEKSVRERAAANPWAAEADRVMAALLD